MPGFVINAIGGNRGGTDASHRFYTSFSWEVLHISGKLPVPAAFENARTLLRSATLPSTTFTKVETSGGTVKYKYAGNPEYEDIRISWYDTQNLSLVYRSWYALIFSAKNGVSAPNAYKSNAVLRKYLADRPNTHGTSGPEPDDYPSGAVKYELFGAWPVAFTESELTYVEASIKHIEISITFDHFTMEETDD